MPPVTAKAIVGQRLRHLTGREQVLLTGRASAGLVAVLQVWGWQGAQLLLPANTCYMVLWAILYSGNLPYLADIDPQTGNLPAAPHLPLDAPRLRAIIPAHLYGLPAPLERLTTWAQAQDAALIEDAALALGGQCGGRPVGAWGDLSLLSFGAGKIIDHTLGGALLTDDRVLADELRHALRRLPLWDEALRQATNQWHAIYWALHQHEAANAALPPLYAPLFQAYQQLAAYRVPSDHWQGLAAALDTLPAEQARRWQVAQVYQRGLAGLPLRSLPLAEGAMLGKFPLLSPPDLRDDLLQHCWENGFHTVTRWYPSLQTMCAALVAAPQPPTPHADALAAQIINLPLEAEQAPALVNCLHEFYAAL